MGTFVWLNWKWLQLYDNRMSFDSVTNQRLQSFSHYAFMQFHKKNALLGAILAPISVGRQNVYVIVACTNTLPNWYHSDKPSHFHDSSGTDKLI